MQALLLSRWTDMPRRDYEEGRGVKGRGVYSDKRKDAVFNSRQHVPGSRDNR
jgi:hypothetical protein